MIRHDEYEACDALELAARVAAGELEMESFLERYGHRGSPDYEISAPRWREGEPLEQTAQLVPLVSGKLARGGKVTAYVCLNRVCRFPTHDPEVFAQQLRNFVAIQ